MVQRMSARMEWDNKRVGVNGIMCKKFTKRQIVRCEGQEVLEEGKGVCRQRSEFVIWARSVCGVEGNVY